jgi:t-SNARE complex subunit (syntaxin)
MTVRFGAPYPAMQTFIHLPSPEVGNSEANTATVEFKRSVNNTKYSYVKSRASRRRLQIRFDMTQAKGFELLEFIRSYQRVQIQYFDEQGQTWVGYFITNPNETETRSLAINNSTAMFGYVTIQIEFEGTLQ